MAFTVTALCRALGVSRSGFYDYLDAPETARERRDADRAAKTRAVFTEHRGRYGSPRVWRELRPRGGRISRKKVASLMRENGLVALKTEALSDLVPDDHDAATRLIAEHIDGYYGPKRRHSVVDHESPIEFELKTQLAAMAA